MTFTVPPNSGGDHTGMQAVVRYATGTPKSRTFLYPNHGFLPRVKVKVSASGQHNLYSCSVPQACNQELP